MDVGKLFKLPELSSGAVNKRKWNAPKPDDAATANTDAGPSEPSSSRPRKAARVDDEDQDDREDSPEVEETHFFSDDDQEDGRFFGGGLTAEQQQILDIMDSGDPTPANQTTSVTDLPALRKQLLRFERAITKNAEMRVKHAHDPARFIDSEADLDAELKSLLVLTTQPVAFYSEFVKLGGAGSLVGLLSHENADIAAAAIEVVEELTDDDVLDQAGALSESENEEQDAGQQALAAMNELVEALLHHSLLDLLVSNLSRFNDRLDPALPEDEAAARAVEAENDAQAIYHTLGAIENLVSSRAAVSEQLVSSTPFLSWALKRLADKGSVDQNTNYAAELLAILLQSSAPNRAALGAAKIGTEEGEEESGIDVLLGILARYRRTPPRGAEEQEFAENIVDALCSSLSDAANKQRFLAGEGVELMALLLKEKKYARPRAVKVLDHAASGAAGAAVCTRIVDASALTPLFAAFIHSTARRAEHHLALFASLFTHLPSDSAQRIRLLAQFVAHDYARTDHLLDVRDALAARLDSPTLPSAGEEDAAYLVRLERGLYSLQLLDTVLAWLAMEDDACQEHVAVMLRRKGWAWKDVARTLREYRGYVGDEVAVEPERAGEAGLMTREILDALIAYLESL
ncbi:uncharacterized protein SRS1_10343 [Sporisorium reilianum f. sp. reilianum]|uniref:Beta-catenin-like protein 1 N-terminal domain-containing protein n=1 Tax=Sporisorium reilianum f. sp. reilianum TaxID=72559 RepID=A0A2N8U9A9_9BASI|nr:uncharacterized protein SRS1_10343 [Sporisorium reilianum f. sp. reilianum]